jgi:hypothetical protein
MGTVQLPETCGIAPRKDSEERGHHEQRGGGPAFASLLL